MEMAVAASITMVHLIQISMFYEDAQYAIIIFKIQLQPCLRQAHLAIHSSHL